MAETSCFFKNFVSPNQNLMRVGITAFFFGYGAGNGQFQRFFVAAEGKFG